MKKKRKCTSRESNPNRYITKKCHKNCQLRIATLWHRICYAISRQFLIVLLGYIDGNFVVLFQCEGCCITSNGFLSATSSKYRANPIHTAFLIYLVTYLSCGGGIEGGSRDTEHGTLMEPLRYKSITGRLSTWITCQSPTKTIGPPSLSLSLSFCLSSQHFVCHLMSPDKFVWIGLFFLSRIKTWISPSPPPLNCVWLYATNKRRVVVRRLSSSSS